MGSYAQKGIRGHQKVGHVSIYRIFSEEEEKF
jgi:hypothetical protein